MIHIRKSNFWIAELLLSSIAKNQPWYGNNDYLLGVLKNYGFDLPSNYFDAIDERGNYNGKRINISDYKRELKGRKYDKTGKKPEGQLLDNLVIGGQGVKYIRLNVFSHLNSFGAGWTANEINDIIAFTNTLFRANGVPIIFYSNCHDITFISNSNYYDIGGIVGIYSMYTTHGQVNTMEIHFVNSAIGASGTFIAGHASGIPGNEGLVTRSSSSSTLAHELGHLLGLKHTHNPEPPCVEEGNEACADCWQESVSRTRTQPVWCFSNVGQKKCAINGDGLCDTPGEPNLSGHVDQNNCSIQWSELDNTDNWGQQWVPMDFNIMSYAANCRDLLSPGQIAIMLANMPSYATTSDPYVISGPTIACINSISSYSIPSLPGVNTYNWIIPNGVTLISGQGTNSIIVRFDNYFQNRIIRVIPNCGSYSEIVISVLGSIAIVGNELPQINQSVTYTASYIPSANYTWYVPSGWTYLFGENSTSLGAITQNYPGFANLSVSASFGSCTLMGYLTVEVQDGGGGIQYLKSTPDEPVQVDVYNPLTGRFDKLQQDYQEALRKLGSGVYILRLRYEFKDSEIIKILKQ